MVKNGVGLETSYNPSVKRNYILRWFGKTEGKAGSGYRKFIQNGINQGIRPELVGSGLIRSMGG